MSTMRKKKFAVAAVVCAVVTVVVAIAAHLATKRERPGYERVHVKRSALPDPRKEDTKWKRLYDNGSDREFVTFLRFDRATFDYMLKFFKPKFDLLSVRKRATSRLKRRVFDVCN